MTKTGSFLIRIRLCSAWSFHFSPTMDPSWYHLTEIYHALFWYSEISFIYSVFQGFLWESTKNFLNTDRIVSNLRGFSQKWGYNFRILIIKILMDIGHFHCRKVTSLHTPTQRGGEPAPDCLQSDAIGPHLPVKVETKSKVRCSFVYV